MENVAIYTFVMFVAVAILTSAWKKTKYKKASNAALPIESPHTSMRLHDRHSAAQVFAQIIAVILLVALVLAPASDADQVYVNIRCG